MYPQNDFDALRAALKAGGIAVVRTDTLYGIVALASDEQAVEKVFKAKGRDSSKQCIVLLADAEDAPGDHTIVAELTAKSSKPLTVIIPATNQPDWLLRGGDSLAYRVVGDALLRDVIRAVGPIIAPSANPEGLPPAYDLAQAKAYFGDTVDVYIDGGTVPADIHASTVVKVQADGSVVTIRD